MFNAVNNGETSIYDEMISIYVFLAFFEHLSFYALTNEQNNKPSIKKLKINKIEFRPPTKMC